MYFQLWLILYHGHKRFSYQTVFLYLCLIWSALRTTLFSFFFKDAATANQLTFFPYWLLFCFPSILQYAIMTLLLVFFSQLIVPAHLRDADELSRRRRRIFAVAGVGFGIFLCTNFVCAILTKYLYMTDLFERVSKANIGRVSSPSPFPDEILPTHRTLEQRHSQDHNAVKKQGQVGRYVCRLDRQMFA